MKKCFFAFLFLSLKILAMEPSTMTTQQLTELIRKLKPAAQPIPQSDKGIWETFIPDNESRERAVAEHRARIQANLILLREHIALLEEELAKR